MVQNYTINKNTLYHQYRMSLIVLLCAVWLCHSFHFPACPILRKLTLVTLIGKSVNLPVVSDSDILLYILCFP